MSAAASQVVTRHDKEHLNPAQRAGEVISLAVMGLVIAYFWQLWTMQSGFFTSAFGPWEQIWFFGPMVLGLAAPLVRLVTGRRNPARPCEIATDLAVIIGALWLLRVFPFDFTHLGDALPGDLPTLFTWVPDWAGRVILVLQAFGGAIALLVTTGQFVRESLEDLIGKLTQS
jgi:hypothetical protein